MLIEGRGKVGSENLKTPKAFTDYSQTINGVYNPTGEWKSGGKGEC